MPNAYSRTWFELFLEARPTTEQEVDFVARHLPNPPYARVLDLCCGQGRLANPLARRGFQAVGVDLDATALDIARRTAPDGVRYLEHDMRRMHELPDTFDAVVCWWQSFGYFDDATIRDVLQQISRKLRVGGRLLLDIYQRGFWEAHQGERRLERSGVPVWVVDTMHGDRLTSHLEYGDGLGSDAFEGQLFDLDGGTDPARRVGLHLRLACTKCDEGKPVTGGEPSIQLVFQKEPREATLPNP